MLWVQSPHSPRITLGNLHEQSDLRCVVKRVIFQKPKNTHLHVQFAVILLFK